MVDATSGDGEPGRAIHGQVPDQRYSATRDFPTLFGIDELLDALDVPVPAYGLAEGGRPVMANCLPSAHGGVLGAQQLAQQVVVAERLYPGRRVQTLQTIFLRPGTADKPVEIDVEPVLAGRSFTSVTLTLHQGSTRLSRANVLLTATEPDFVRHDALADPATWTEPADAVPVGRVLLPWQARAVPGGDRHGHDLWLRTRPWTDPDQAVVPDDPTMWRALLTFASETTTLSDVIEGHGLHVGTFSSAVVAHTVTVVGDLDVRDWHLLRIDSPHAGGGRSLSHGRVYDIRRRLMASFETVGMLRALTPSPHRVGVD